LAYLAQVVTESNPSRCLDASRVFDIQPVGHCDRRDEIRIAGNELIPGPAVTVCGTDYELTDVAP
jgi:hypothetical protein